MAKDDYEIGYKKPPKDTQFKKGQSGNNKGRPKKCRDQTIDVESILNEQVTINMPDGERTMSSRELQLQSWMKSALSGDVAAIDYMLKKFDKYGAINVPIRESGHGVAVMPTDTFPMQVCSCAFTQYGHPPWIEKQLQPIIEDYLAHRTEAQRIDDERMRYEL